MYKRPGFVALVALCIPLFALVLAASHRDDSTRPGRLASVAAPPISGLKAIPGDYQSLTAAADDLLANGVDGPVVLELQPGYVSAVETFPITFGPVAGAGAANTITIRPAATATGRAIASSNAGPAIRLGGASHVVIDGRPGGAGTARELTISNSNIAGSALRLENDAHDNAVRFVVLRSANASGTGGTVEFGVSAGGAGNDDNLIENSDIADGSATPANAINSEGSPGAQSNSGNTISGNYIFNFFRPDTDSAGVRLESGNTGWTISGNHFYQTVPRTTTAGVTARGIYVNDETGGGFEVSGNVIGGSAPSAAGLRWQVFGNFPNRVDGILLHVGTVAPSAVQGNRVARIDLSTTSNASALPGVFTGIYVSGGSVDVGTLTGNVVGATTGNDNVIVTANTTGAVTYGIGSAGGGEVSIANNAIGAIRTNGSGSVSHSLVGIQAEAATSIIEGNTVGSATTANSLNANAQSTSATGQYLTGIHSVAASSVISGNFVANARNVYVGASAQAQIRGIVALGGGNIIHGNTVTDLFSTNRNTGAGLGASLVGIGLSSEVEGQSVTSNTVRSGLVSPQTAAAIQINGIVFDGPDTGSNVVADNFVHSFKPETTAGTPNASGALNGIWALGGSATYTNNMVRVGIDHLGAELSGNPSIAAIRDSAGGANSYYHNSLYVGGAHNVGDARTQAFLRTVTGTTDFRNNLVVNVRSVGSSLSTHYGIVVNDVAGFTSDFNGFHVTGPWLAGVGTSTLTTHANLAAWRFARGLDLHSFSGNPNYVSPTTDAGFVNLHLNSPTPAESAGVAIAGIEDDFDRQDRGSLTPVDVGADANNFTANDLSGPVIVYEALADSDLLATRTFTATITDLLGVPTAGEFVPRVYYRKNGGTWASEPGTLENGSGTNGVWSLSIDPARMGGVIVGDVVQYFAVAQDLKASPNMGAHPGSVVATSVLTITQFPGQLFAFTVIAPPTSTRTPSATETSTPTSTPNATGTSTSTPSATPSATVTAMPSATVTGTSTPTLTHTPAASATATRTPTSTISATATATTTSTATPSPTATGVPTSTSTPSATSSVTPSSTSTPSATPNSTSTSTPEPSATTTTTPTISSTATATETPAPTATSTGTSTSTSTQTPVPTATGTATSTVTRTATPHPTVTGTATSTASATPSSTHTREPTSTVTATVTATSTSTATETATSTVTPSSTANATNTAVPTSTRTATETPEPTATATLTNTATATGPSTPTVTRTVTATPSPTQTPSRTATATASNTASPSPSPSRTASPSATWTSTSTVTATRTPSATPSATGTVTSTATPTRTATATATIAATTTLEPTVTATGTPTSTSTSTPSATPTNSPTASPTPCVMTFGDVSPGDWFYLYVRYMYCGGIVSGYPDGTFRPNASTTRGQTAKIVTLSFGFEISTEGGPHFSDVPEGSTFYPYIETLYNLGVVGGYGDGRFGPNNSITRGQIAKVVVGAAAVADPPNWQIYPPPTNTFEDVPAGSTFFAYVEVAASHGLLQGYPCGVPPAGPCGAGDRPYFLPYAQATRAQISKVVYLAVTYEPQNLQR